MNSQSDFTCTTRHQNCLLYCVDSIKIYANETQENYPDVLAINVPWTVRVTAMLALPATLLPTHSYIPESSVVTRSILSAPLASRWNVEVSFTSATSSPLVVHVTWGAGIPVTSHVIRTGLSTMTVYSSCDNAISGGTADIHTHRHSTHTKCCCSTNFTDLIIFHSSVTLLICVSLLLRRRHHSVTKIKMLTILVLQLQASVEQTDRRTDWRQCLLYNNWFSSDKECVLPYSECDYNNKMLTFGAVT